LPTIVVYDSDFARPNTVINADPVSLPKTTFSDKPTSRTSRPPIGVANTLPLPIRPAEAKKRMGQ
jgi:hypothetical protein